MAVAFAGFFLVLAVGEAVAFELVGLVDGDVDGALAAFRVGADAVLHVLGVDGFEVEVGVVFEGVDDFF